METFIGIVGEYVGKAVVSALGRLLSKTSYDPLSVAGRLRHQITEAESWSRYIQQFGAAEPLDTDSVTVRLRMYTGLRRESTDHTPTRTEEDLLRDASHFLVLGQPGAGKTTTLKRLVRRLLFDEPLSEGDIYQYPIAIRLREHAPALSLANILAAILGISPEKRITPAESRPPDAPPLSDEEKSRWVEVQYVGDLTLQQFLVDFFVIIDLTQNRGMLPGHAEGFHYRGHRTCEWRPSGGAHEERRIALVRGGDPLVADYIRPDHLGHMVIRADRGMGRAPAYKVAGMPRRRWRDPYLDVATVT